MIPAMNIKVTLQIVSVFSSSRTFLIDGFAVFRTLFRFEHIRCFLQCFSVYGLTYSERVTVAQPADFNISWLSPVNRLHMWCPLLFLSPETTEIKGETLYQEVWIKLWLRFPKKEKIRIYFDLFSLKFRTTFGATLTNIQIGDLSTFLSPSRKSIAHLP